MSARKQELALCPLRIGNHHVAGAARVAEADQRLGEAGADLAQRQVVDRGRVGDDQRIVLVGAGKLLAAPLRPHDDEAGVRQQIGRRQERKQPPQNAAVEIADHLGDRPDLHAGLVQRFQQRPDRRRRAPEIVDGLSPLDLRHDQVGAARHMAQQVDQLEHADDGAVAQHRHVAHAMPGHQQLGAEQERVVVDGHRRERGHLLDRRVERQPADQGGAGEIRVGHDP